MNTLIYLLGIIIVLTSMSIHKTKGWIIYGIGTATTIGGYLL